MENERGGRRYRKLQRENLMSALNKVLEAVVILSFQKSFVVHSPSGLVVLKCKSDIKNQIILT